MLIISVCTGVSSFAGDGLAIGVSFFTLFSRTVDGLSVPKIAAEKMLKKIKATNNFAGKVHPTVFLQYGQIRASFGIIMAQLLHFFVSASWFSFLPIGVGVSFVIFLPQHGHIVASAGIIIVQRVHFISSICYPRQVSMIIMVRLNTLNG
jgi:hypothetical protein